MWRCRAPTEDRRKRRERAIVHVAGGPAHGERDPLVPEFLGALSASEKWRAFNLLLHAFAEAAATQNQASKCKAGPP